MALQFKKCKTCGKIFQSLGSLECPDCIEERERKFQLVKEYLYKEPGASLEKLAEETGVEEKLIIRFLKEGRLEMTSVEGLLTCEKCGAPVTSGTMCDKCKDKLARAMQSVLPSSKGATAGKSLTGKPGKDKMHGNVRTR